ncbi:MAG TPA: FMN-binding negative transcriptional regulator [Paludibaculum sp.]
MYNPAYFQESRPDILAGAIAAHPLATLVTSGAAGLQASHIPLLYTPGESTPGTLRGHMARANPHWRDAVPPCEALAIFSGPQHYISPNWYPSKHEDGKVVPTWNYVVVHAHGTLSIRDDPQWLLANVSALTDHHEDASPTPWRVSDAPPAYIEGLLKAIVGIELTITRWEGKWKLSQNRSTPDRAAVAAGLAALADLEAGKLAKFVK